MNGTGWQFTDETRRFVSRTNEADQIESCVADREDVQAWVDEGNVIQEAPAPELSKEDLDLAAARRSTKVLQALDLSVDDVGPYVDEHVKDIASARELLKTLLTLAIVSRRQDLKSGG